MSEDYKKYYKGKVILVTGGAGAIGINFCTALAGEGAKMVIVLDNLSSGYTWNMSKKKNIMFVRGSITDDIYLKQVFSEKPEYVFHLAAFFANQNSVDYPERDLSVNGFGTLKMLEYSFLNKVKRFIYISSSSIYGSPTTLPVKEELITMNLSTPYQITKMLGEMYCNFFKNYYDLKVVKTRFFNSYGPGEVPGHYRNVIPNFIYWAMKGKSLLITGTGDETRDFTYVTDIVDGLLRVGYYEEAIGQEFNLASGKETKIIDIANRINKIIGNKAGIKFVQKRKWDSKSRFFASINKAKKIIGYEPKIEFKDGLINTINWFKENWNKIEQSASFGPGASSAVRDIQDNAT